MTTTPYWWSEGDEPTAARLNGLLTAMDEIFATTRDYGYQHATNYIGTGGKATLFKHARYLHFGSNGTLEDPAAVEDDVTLSEDPDTGRGTVDLDDIDWLATGAMFYVHGCNRVWMDNTP